MNRSRQQSMNPRPRGKNRRAASGERGDASVGYGVGATVLGPHVRMAAWRRNKKRNARLR
jgi:hypothetical protein